MLSMIENKGFLNTSLEPQRPIEFLTENGFSIIRLSEIDKSIPAVGTTHQFLVRDPDGFELEITVDVAPGAVALKDISPSTCVNRKTIRRTQG